MGSDPASRQYQDDGDHADTRRLLKLMEESTYESEKLNEAPNAEHVSAIDAETEARWREIRLTHLSEQASSHGNKFTELFDELDPTWRAGVDRLMS